jgi:hypothetical protein
MGLPSRHKDGTIKVGDTVFTRPMCFLHPRNGFRNLSVCLQVLNHDDEGEGELEVLSVSTRDVVGGDWPTSLHRRFVLLLPI